ncbi:alpha-amylase family glycosyl hydrolase [Teichococcus coralli]|nr:alpha-amylase family glycosyl hydrolase [Pseudoroseomonas coralli]
MVAAGGHLADPASLLQDSDGDGFGDLPGILRRLDHLAWLGVNAIWLSPSSIPRRGVTAAMRSAATPSVRRCAGIRMNLMPASPPVSPGCRSAPMPKR